MVVEFGFVPKSNRIYYTQRSNPPFLTLMAYNFILKTSDYDWLQKNIEYLEFELTFWIKNRSIVIEKDKKLHTMFRYSVNCFTPRPESYKSDMELAEELDGKDRKKFFKEINSASESGWDISSRWLNDGDVLDVNVSRVIPVDLNSYLYKNFVCISKLFNMLGNNSKSIVWRKKAKKLHLAIRKILWNETEGIWFDYDLELNRSRSQFYLSNFTPLWAGAFPTRLRYEYGYYASLYIDKYDLIGKYKGCIPDSLQESFQLYDFPNSHTHLLVMVIEGLKSSLHLGAIKKSNVILVNWMDVVMSCWAETNSIFDTYNVKEFGQHTSYTEWSEDHTVTIGAFLSVLDSYYTISERFISNESFGRRLNALCFIFNFIAYVVK
nr:trehalase-like [Onthophagus taurus]